MYDKIPDVAIIMAVIIAAIVVVKIVAPTLTLFSLVAGIVLGIILCYRIRKNVNRSLEEDDKDSNIIEFPKK